MSIKVDKIMRNKNLREKGLREQDIGGNAGGATSLVGEISNADTNPNFPEDAKPGDMWMIVENSGTVGDVTVEVGDYLIYGEGGWFVMKSGLGNIDTDGTLAANSDEKVPSQKAVKTYVDAQMMKGISSWSPETDYDVYDQVWYPGNKKLYFCNFQHNSGLDFDATKWVELSHSIFPISTKAIAKTYKRAAETTFIYVEDVETLYVRIADTEDNFVSNDTTILTIANDGGKWLGIAGRHNHFGGSADDIQIAEFDGLKIYKPKEVVFFNYRLYENIWMDLGYPAIEEITEYRDFRPYEWRELSAGVVTTQSPLAVGIAAREGQLFYLKDKEGIYEFRENEPPSSMPDGDKYIPSTYFGANLEYTNPMFVKIGGSGNSSGGDSTPRWQIFVGKHGDDNNSGRTYAEAKLTIDAGLEAARELVMGVDLQSPYLPFVDVVVVDAGNYELKTYDPFDMENPEWFYGPLGQSQQMLQIASVPKGVNLIAPLANVFGALIVEEISTIDVGVIGGNYFMGENPETMMSCPYSGHTITVVSDYQNRDPKRAVKIKAREIYGDITCIRQIELMGFVGVKTLEIDVLELNNSNHNLGTESPYQSAIDCDGTVRGSIGYIRSFSTGMVSDNRHLFIARYGSTLNLDVGFVEGSPGGYGLYAPLHMVKIEGQADVNIKIGKDETGTEHLFEADASVNSMNPSTLNLEIGKHGNAGQQSSFILPPVDPEYLTFSVKTDKRIFSSALKNGNKNHPGNNNYEAVFVNRNTGELYTSPAGGGTGGGNAVTEFQCTVGTDDLGESLGADYETIGAALNAGKTSILVIGKCVENSTVFVNAINIGQEIYIKGAPFSNYIKTTKNHVVDMGQYRFNFDNGNGVTLRIEDLDIHFSDDGGYNNMPPLFWLDNIFQGGNERLILRRCNIRNQSSVDSPLLSGSVMQTGYSGFNGYIIPDFKDVSYVVDFNIWNYGIEAIAGDDCAGAFTNPGSSIDSEGLSKRGRIENMSIVASSSLQGGAPIRLAGCDVKNLKIKIAPSEMMQQVGQLSFCNVDGLTVDCDNPGSGENEIMIKASNVNNLLGLVNITIFDEGGSHFNGIRTPENGLDVRVAGMGGKSQFVNVVECEYDSMMMQWIYKKKRAINFEELDLMEIMGPDCPVPFGESFNVKLKPIENVSLQFPTLVEGQIHQIKIVDGGTHITFPPTIKWRGGIEPTLSTSGIDIISLYYDGVDLFGDYSIGF